MGKLLCSVETERDSAWPPSTDSQVLLTAVDVLAPFCSHALGSSNVYVMKGNRRWLFLSAAFPRTHTGPVPAMMETLSSREPREMGEGGQGKREAHKQRNQR